MKNHPSFLNCRVVGQYFREREGIPAFQWTEDLELGEEISFEREPENPHDPNAIRLLCEGQHMAFVERASAAFIAPVLDDGVKYRAVVSEKSEDNRERAQVTVDFLPLDDQADD